ncbi:MAG: membrane protein [Peptococcaceae bacterium BICA1-7]|nr:MAG: membrane protein [Peptococcaceae bacterium BICA1-7]HBV98367.1 putative sulfate exporter family transporter [Desulfotomaculum sp.]
MEYRKAPLYIRVVPGIVLMLSIAVLTRGGADLGFPQWQGIELYINTNEYINKSIIEIFHLNYIVLSIIAGMLIGNSIGIPSWAADGVKTSRVFIKLGVVLLGSLYSVSDIALLGSGAIMLVLSFVSVTLLFTMWLGKKSGMESTSAAVLSAGVAVCGVSAIVATAPAVRAKTTDVVYSIATILSFGLASLFIFPIIGTLAGLTPHQFGAWAGTGILNSGQVLAVCLSFDPGTASHPSLSLKTGEIYNLVRVIFLPFVVLALAVYTSRMAKLPEDEININTGLWSKFPLFVGGFMVMAFITSFGVLGQTSPPSEEIILIRKLYSWFFAIGLTGLGMQISFTELRKAGGRPLMVGTTAALLKAIAALILVLWAIPEQP